MLKKMKNDISKQIYITSHHFYERRLSVVQEIQPPRIFNELSRCHFCDLHLHELEIGCGQRGRDYSSSGCDVL